MNTWETLGLWLSGLICGVALTWGVNEAMAETTTAQRGGSYVPAELDSRVDKYCSEQSIQGSESAFNRAKITAQQAMQSVVASPEARMMSRLDVTLRNIALEDLVLKCALVRALDRGV